MYKEILDCSDRVIMKLKTLFEQLYQNRRQKHSFSSYVMNNMSVLVEGENYRVKQFEIHFKNKSRINYQIKLLKNALKINLGVGNSYLLIDCLEDEFGHEVNFNDFKKKPISLNSYQWPVEKVYSAPRIHIKPNGKNFLHLFKNYRFLIKPSIHTKGLDLFFLSMKVRRRMEEFNQLCFVSSFFKVFEDDFYSGMRLNKEFMKKLDFSKKADYRKLYGFLFKKIFDAKDFLVKVESDLVHENKRDSVNVTLELAIDDHKGNPKYWMTWARALNMRGHYTAALEAIYTSFCLDKNNGALYSELINTSILSGHLSTTMSFIEMHWSKIETNSKMCFIETLEEYIEVGEIELYILPIRFQNFYKVENVV